MGDLTGGAIVVQVAEGFYPVISRRFSKAESLNHLYLSIQGTFSLFRYQDRWL